MNQFISAIDKNGDGKIAKAELFDILKQLINNGWKIIFMIIYIYKLAYLFEFLKFNQC